MREAGLGSGAGLGLEALRRELLGLAVRPLAPATVSPVTAHQMSALFSHPGSGGPIPNAAPRRPPYDLSPSVRRSKGAARTRKGFAVGCAVAASTAAPPPPGVAPSAPPWTGSRVESRLRAGRGRRMGIHPQGLASAPTAAGDRVFTQVGSNGPACTGRFQGRAAYYGPAAPRAKSSDRRVSDPSVERARLRGRGGSGSLLLRQQQQPSLATNPLRLAPSDQLRTGTDQGNPTV